MRLYGDKVFSLVYRMLGNRPEAEDIAQEVFITVFKTVDGFRGEAKFSTWLLRIAANQCKNRIKYLARRPTEAASSTTRAEAQALSVAQRAAGAGADRRARRAAGGGRDWRRSCRARSARWTRSTACW